MAMDGKLLKRAREKALAIQAENIAERERRQNKIYAEIPEIYRIDARLRLQMTELVKLTVRGGEMLLDKLAALEKENLELQAKRAELLVGHGYPVEYLDEIYSCPECRDTGFVGTKMCSCLKRLYNAELTAELSTLLKDNGECFEGFRLDYYGDARESMEIVYSTCKAYAQNFSPSSVNLLMQGGTGLGKTFLSASIARVVAAKGYSVCYDSAGSALEAFETKKFARDIEKQEAAALKVERMLECELMILDDLGTEMPTPMAQSALYTLINTRLVNGKKTIVSTNLSDSELERRYSPQIASRLDGEFAKLPFFGTDIRKLKKEI